MAVASTHDFSASAAVALRILGTRAAQSEDAVSDSPAVASEGRGTGSASRFMLSVDAIRQMYGEDSPILAYATGDDRVEIRLATIPGDKDSFRAKVIDRLGEFDDYANDASFVAARAAGTIEVFTADEVPELNMQSEINYTIYKNGSIFGSGGYGIVGQFNQALADEWGKSWNQSYGSVDEQLYYMRWPKT